MTLDLIPQTGVAIVVDGGCTNNHLPENTRSLYGSFAVFFKGKRVEQITHYGVKHISSYTWEADMTDWREVTGTPATNNVAECEMMCQALTYAKRISKNPDFAKIVFLGDSQVVSAYAKGGKVGKDAKHLQEYRDAIHKGFSENPNFSIVHMDDKTVKAILGH